MISAPACVSVLNMNDRSVKVIMFWSWEEMQTVIIPVQYGVLLFRSCELRSLHVGCLFVGVGHLVNTDLHYWCRVENVLLLLLLQASLPFRFARSWRLGQHWAIARTNARTLMQALKKKERVLKWSCLFVPPSAQLQVRQWPCLLRNVSHLIRHREFSIVHPLVRGHCCLELRWALFEWPSMQIFMYSLF